MFKNYLKIGWRNLVKNKAFSTINILGLTMGITVCLLIFLFILNEFSVDSFHKDGDRIYRVMRGFDKLKAPVPYLSGPYAPALLNDYPNEIKKAVRVMPSNNLISFDNKSFNEVCWLADPDFFTLFSFPMIQGDRNTALKDPNSIVLTESTAKKYFGNTNPIGKVLELDKTTPLKVTGVMKDIPSNSHLNFDLIRSITVLESEDFFKVWINNSMFVYAQLDNNVKKEQLEQRFPQFMQKYMGKDMERMGVEFSLSLTPLKDIYFEDASSFDNVKHGDKKVVYIFLSIAVLILVIACINFMNLSTIRAVERSKEVGLRKVMGALRNHLIWQFIGESVLLTLISTILAVGLLQLLIPFYNELLGYPLTVSWNSPPIYLFLLGVVLIIGFLAGCYPAFFLSAFSPIQALKGKLRLGKGGSLFRQALVVVQFSISVFLIIGTLIINKQMGFVKNKELGYNQEQTVLLPIDNGDIFNNRVSFKNNLQQSPMIKSVSSMSGAPSGFFDMMSFEAEGQRDMWKSRTEYSDFEFVKTLGLKIIAGRDFSSAFPTDTTDAVLINRTAANSLHFSPDQAIGKWIKNTIRDTTRRRVIGVVEDFNFLSLKENIDPLVISPSEDRRVIAIKLSSKDLQPALAVIKNAYSKAAPGYPFEYEFLDQQFDEVYRNDLRQQKILSIFSGLAIFIACLGLFGLASFTAAKRIKEIGVRKVLGSTERNIVFLLSKDLLRPVIIATLIAVPMGYYAMNTWLQNFAYRTQLSWWVFGIAALITFGIAFVTISFKAIRAAMANPTKSLRSE